jgi:hypothetical protein
VRFIVTRGYCVAFVVRVKSELDQILFEIRCISAMPEIIQNSNLFFTYISFFFKNSCFFDGTGRLHIILSSVCSVCQVCWSTNTTVDLRALTLLTAPSTSSQKGKHRNVCLSTSTAEPFAGSWTLSRDFRRKRSAAAAVVYLCKAVQSAWFSIYQTKLQMGYSFEGVLPGITEKSVYVWCVRQIHCSHLVRIKVHIAEAKTNKARF